MKTLSEIQRELKAPKGQTNQFGKYKYRSCEDILEAVKPLLEGWVLTISDEIVLIGERYYIKAVACIYNDDTKNPKHFQVSSYAREPDVKKGMDSSQITGAASSYARKYALNGLFCIDDTKDADTMDNRKKYDHKDSGSPRYVKLIRDQVKDHLAKGAIQEEIERYLGVELADIPNQKPKELQRIYEELGDM